MLSHQSFKFGEYSVNGQLYTSKQQALLAANGNTELVTFHFNDEVYNRFDWTRDPLPQQSLTDLYRVRAQEIRESYDYVALMFSGGPDSTNMLESFVFNDYRVDEIINYNSFGSTGVIEGTINNADYVYNCKPKLEQLARTHNFHPRITIIDEVEMTQIHWKNMYQAGWEDMSWDFGGPGQFLGRGYVVKYLPHLWNMLTQGKKIALVSGSEKPIGKLINNKYAIEFTDIVTGHYNELSKEWQFPESDFWLWFYHAPSTAPLIIKQLHTLKNFVEQNLDPQLFSKEPPMRGYRQAHFWPSKHGWGNLRYDIYHKLIYPNWTPRFVTPKSIDFVFRPQDNWWVKDLKTPVKSVWEHSMKKFVRQNQNNLKLPLGLLGAATKSEPRYIE